MKFVKCIFIMVTILFILSSCDKSGNLGSEESLYWHSRTSIADKIKYFKPKCLAYGFKENTDAMRQCVVDEMRISKKDANDYFDKEMKKYNSSPKFVISEKY